MKSLNLQRTVAISLIIGCLAFFLIVGPKALDPSNILWLSQGDPLQHYMGWAFFQHSEWTFPPGLNPKFGLDISSSIVFSDSIPLFAFPFKAFRYIFPDVFQYFGLWLFLCCVMQVFFALQLMKLITNNLTLQVLGVGFYIFSPPMLWRVGVHAALASHFLILAGLYLNLRGKNSGNIVYWGILLSISVAIHFYLFAMVFALFIPFAIRYQRNLGAILVRILPIILSVSVVMYLCGYFAVGASSSIGQGYGGYRFNLFSLFDPHGWSLIIPANPQFNFDYEGFNYLGLGSLVLIFIAVLSVVSKRNHLRLFDAINNHRYLFLMIFTLTIFSLSNNVWIGQYHFYIPLPESILNAANILRASSRLIWPAIYIGIFGVIFIIIRNFSPKISILILTSCLLLQIADTSAGWMPLRKKLMASDLSIDDPFKSGVWKNFAGHYKKVVYFPLSCKQEQRGWANLTRFAATNNLGTTAVYLARIDCEKALSSNKSFEINSFHGIYDDSTLYIFDLWKYDPDRKSIQFDKKSDLLASIDGFTVLAPGWKKLFPKDSMFEELSSITPTTQRETPILFNNRSDGAKNFLLTGWGSQEEWGTWSVGNNSNLVIPLPHDQPQYIIFRVRAFIAHSHPRQSFNISINQKLIEKVTINSTTINEIIIPLGSDTRMSPFISIDIESINPQSPSKAIGISTDSRLLGLGLESIKFR